MKLDLLKNKLAFLIDRHWNRLCFNRMCGLHFRVDAMDLFVCVTWIRAYVHHAGHNQEQFLYGQQERARARWRNGKRSEQHFSCTHVQIKSNNCTSLYHCNVFHCCWFNFRFGARQIYGVTTAAETLVMLAFLQALAPFIWKIILACRYHFSFHFMKKSVDLSAFIVFLSLSLFLADFLPVSLSHSLKSCVDQRHMRTPVSDSCPNPKWKRLRRRRFFHAFVAPFLSWMIVFTLST